MQHAASWTVWGAGRFPRFRGGCRTNKARYTNRTMAVLADLVGAAQAVRARPPRPKWFTAESRLDVKRTKLDDDVALSDSHRAKRGVQPEPRGTPRTVKARALLGDRVMASPQISTLRRARGERAAAALGGTVGALTGERSVPSAPAGPRLCTVRVRPRARISLAPSAIGPVAADDRSGAVRWQEPLAFSG